MVTQLHTCNCLVVMGSVKFRTMVRVADIQHSACGFLGTPQTSVRSVEITPLLQL